MPAETPISLNASQLKLVEMTVRNFDRETSRDGTALFDLDAVRAVFWAESGSVLQAGVEDMGLNAVTILFLSHSMQAWCTCEGRTLCRHVAAVILHLQAHAMVAGKPRAAASKAPAKTAPSTVVVAQPAADSLPGRAAARLGIQLTAAQMTFLQQVALWWEGRRSIVPQQDLLKLCGRQSHWGYGQVRLWPDEHPPVDEGEFFACLALALQSCQLALPAALGPLADPAVQKRIMQKWTRLKQIDEWRQRLGSWQEPQSHLAAEAPELRLLLNAAGALVQVRHSGESEFGKTTQKLLKQLWSSANP